MQTVTSSIYVYYPNVCISSAVVFSITDIRGMTEMSLIYGPSATTKNYKTEPTYSEPAQHLDPNAWISEMTIDYTF